MAAVRRRGQKEPAGSPGVQTNISLRARRALRFHVVVIVWLLAWPAAAHPVPFSYLDLRLQPNVIEGTLVAHIFDVAHDLNIEPPERLLDPAVASQQSAAIARLLGGRLAVTANGITLTPQWSYAQVVADRQSLKLAVRYPLPGRAGTVAVTTRMFPYDPQHQTFLNIYEDAALTQAILDGSRTSFEYFAGTRQGAFAVVKKFLPAGIHHILIGPDHLLFLVGLLLLGGSVRQLATIVTSFTVAHSITLSLAALNIVSPPARIIEPAIALSIIYVGADNLLIRDGRDVRAWIAFAFGFIHGFGFANVLREMDLPARALGWSLFSFNVGVEVGQLLVVAAVATALAALRARSEAAGRQLAFAGSIVVMAAGAFWFVQRVFFPGGIS
jgi:hydrogenase/urease accessory protein HupE